MTGWKRKIAVPVSRARPRPRSRLWLLGGTAGGEGKQANVVAVASPTGVGGRVELVGRRGGVDVYRTLLVVLVVYIYPGS